jgi:MFS family permease
MLFGENSKILKDRQTQLLLLANILAPLGVVVMSPVLDSLIAPLGASATSIGLMISVYTAPAIFLIPIFGALGDRYGRKHVLIPSIFVFGTADILIPFAMDFRTVLFLRMVQGIGFLTYNSIIVAHLMSGTPTDAGILAGLWNMSLAAAASQSGRLVDWFGNRYTPLVVGHGCLGIGFVIMLFVPSVFLAAFGIAVAGSGFGFTLSLYRNLITDLSPETLRAGLVSVAETAGRLTATLTPLLMAYVINVVTPTTGFQGAVQVAGLVVALLGGAGGIICLSVVRTGPNDLVTGTDVS